METFFNLYGDYFVRLLLAVFLGMIIGAERIIHGKTAGMRTYAMVAMGSSLFVIISEMLLNKLGPAGIDPIRMASQVVVGVGFLGAGMIVFHEHRLTGLTTASGLWVSAAMGVASGFGFYGLAIIAAVLTFFIFSVLYIVEQRFKKVAGVEEESTEGYGHSRGEE